MSSTHHDYLDFFLAIKEFEGHWKHNSAALKWFRTLCEREGNDDGGCPLERTRNRSCGHRPPAWNGVLVRRNRHEGMVVVGDGVTAGRGFVDVRRGGR